MAEATDSFRCAVVTGGNKGIGYGICRQLALKGIVVVLTARDEKKGVEAIEKLKESGVSENVLFHQLDVADPVSVTAPADFIKIKYGKLDILINNAGVSGAIIDYEALDAAGLGQGGVVDWKKITTQTYELIEECLNINYYGAKRTIEALLPLLQQSNSTRIVNVSSSLGRLSKIPSEWARGVLGDAESLTEERVDEVVREFVKDSKDGSLETKGWPPAVSAYVVSKACMNAYTRVLAKKYPSFRINCLCPGYVKTDINNHVGTLTIDEGAEKVVRLALLPDDGPSGLFFSNNEATSFE